MSVGFRTLHVPDAAQGVDLPVHLVYPSDAPAATLRFGAYALEAAADGPLVGERLPLVVFSHGSGSTPWVLRGLAARLAAAGFAVALVEHLGDCRSDASLSRTPANLANRPRHTRLALDAAFAALGPHLVPGSAAVVGHSMGGYTALAVAGGRPMALPEETADRVAHPVDVAADDRVRAVVLLAPALPWLMAPGALAAVRAPLLVRTGEHDGLAPPAFVESVLRGLPPGASLDYAVVPGAGHFSFLAPFPEAMVAAAFAPSQDPPGFDRAGYQARLGDEVAGFLRRELRATRP